MIFRLKPSSGHADSCLDVKFYIKVDQAEKLKIELFNDTVNEQLNILSVTQGCIEEEVRAIVFSNTMEGYINIFNQDKLNKKFNQYNSVDIKCVVTIDDIHKEEEIITFYNESKPLDADIIPFDVIIDNPEVDLRNLVPLSLHIICDSEKKYELSIRSINDNKFCSFEVVTKKGRTDVLVPAEVLWADLDLSSGHKKYQLYWTKFEGITYMRFMNRKYIPISDSRITFNTTNIKPLSQNRKGPTGKDMSSDFVLSHRYFVHTWKEFTAFSNRIISWNRNMDKALQFIHESQDLQSDISIVARPKQQERITDKVESFKASTDSRQRLLINAYKTAFAQRKQKQAVTPQSSQHVETFSKSNIPSSKKGCGCSRKKNV